MHWLHAQMALLDAARAVVSFAANWLLQSTLLIAAGLAVAWFLGRRGSALQSAMYRTTLAAVIVCPLVTSLLARGGVSGWSVELSVAWGYEELKSFPPESAEEATVVANSAAQGGPLPGDFGIVTGVGWDKRVERAPAHHAARPSRWAGARKLAFSTLQPAAEPPVSPNAPVRQSAAEARQPSAFHVRAFGYAAIGIALIWLAVSAWLLARLGLAWRRLGRLRRAAAVAEPTAQQACRELSALLAVAAPEVRRSPYLASPCLAGLRRPVVLLPEAEASLPLRDVLVHELAHLRRRDGWWNLLMRLTEALFFYQPLVWLLARRLESAAEEVCDDYVVQLGGDREGYARGLLEIAELSSPPVGAAGVAMVSLRSILARRVTRIVDSSRSLSTRTGNLLVVLIIAGGLIGATAVGFVGLGQRPSLADPPAASDAVDKKANAEAGKADDTESKRKAAEERGKPREQTDKPERAPDNQLHGIVVGADGKPVAGARLYWIRARVHDLQPEPPRLLATTGDDGKYHFAEPPPVEPTMPASWSYTDRIAVTAPGHGFAFTSPDEIRRATSPPAGFLEALARAVTGAQQERTRLPEAGEPVRGRLIDIDGQPVAGAKVRIRWFNGERDIGGYGDAEARGVENAVWRQRVANLMNVIEPVQLRDVLPSAVTDATGRFELRDIGAKRFVQLLVRGDGIEATEIVARNEPGEKIVLDRFEGGGTLAVYSNEFDFVVGPSKPVEGRVLDLDTGEPIADAVVRAFQVQGQLVTTSREREHLAATTDAAGRYRITGLPVGSGNSLVAFATGNAAYIPVGHATDTSAQGAVIERDFRLKRGVWAEGRVFDAETRKPFTGEISYHFFQNRELEEAIPGLTEAFLDGRYWTNANGEFRVPVLPSRGILAFRYDGFDKHHDIDRYPRGFGANEIAGGKDLGGGKVFPTLQQQLISTNYERVAEVSTTAGQESVRVDMPLFVSRPVAVRVVDPKGNPVVGFLAHGANERWGWQNQEGPQFEIQDLLPGERRKVFVFHRWRNLAGGGFVQYGGKETVEIKLVSGGSVQGRLVDADGEPIDDATISAAFAHDNSAVWAPHPSLARSPTGIPVDKQGRFRLDGLIPGWTYYSNASAPRPYQGQTIDMFIGIPFKDVQVNAGEVKDLGDLVVGDDSVSDNQEKGASSTQPVKESIVSGRVRDGDGRPVAGAAVDVRLAVFDADDPPLASTATDDAGRFEFSLRWPQFDERIGAKPDLLVVATADGLAPDWKYLRKDQPPGDIVLNLPEEKTITGRIVNAEGRPLAGVELRVETILRYDGDMMKMVLDDVAQGRTLLRMGKDWQYGALPKQPARVTTAADGRFRIAGLSANTVVKLHVRGAGIRHTTFEATTAVRETIRGPAPPVEPTSAPRAGRVLYGAVSDYVAEPARSIEGVVRDRATRRPVRGVKVRCWNTTTAVAETDEAGRYVLEGCGKEPNYTLSVEPRADGPAYFRASPTVADATGLAPLVQDVELVQGIELRGTIVDSETGRPLVAGIHYQPLYLNKHVASLAEQGVDLHSHSRSGPDGSFRIVVAPGPGALAVDRPDGVPNGYATIRVGYDDVVKLFERSPEHRALAHLPELKRGLPDSLPTARAGLAFGFMSQVGHARTVLISPDARTPPEPLDVRLVRGRTLSGQVLDASGQPLAGARA
ncbi:MAG TPA: M56 family metallopeptidase, partial [Pirellulales bacterium]|nr:M56 family metallopeptidase [Pirellulales bacterium]